MLIAISIIPPYSRHLHLCQLRHLHRNKLQRWAQKVVVAKRQRLTTKTIKNLYQYRTKRQLVNTSIVALKIPSLEDLQEYFELEILEGKIIYAGPTPRDGYFFFDDEEGWEHRQNNRAGHWDRFIINTIIYKAKSKREMMTMITRSIVFFTQALFVLSITLSAQRLDDGLYPHW